MSKIELTRKWWNANRPKEVKGLELEKALAAVEQAPDEARAAALAAVPGAIAKVSKGLDKKAQKDLLKSLDALGDLAESEAKKAAAATAKAEVEAKKTAAAAKANAESLADDKDETPDDKLFDPDFLRGIIRNALRKPLVFGFAIGSKPEQSAFALAMRGNPKRLLRLAKERSGSLKACCGQAQAAADEPKTLTLSLDGPLVSGVVRALRKYFQMQGITLFRKVRVLVDGKEAEAESDDETPAEATGARAPASVSTPTPEPPSAPPTAQEMEVLEDRRREFKKSRAAWTAVKTKAEVDLEKVKDGARTAYLADAKQFPKIVQGCKDIDAILDNLDDELRDTLDQYASTPLKNQARLHALATTAAEILDRYRTYVEGNPVMKAIDLKEFADVTIHAPVMKALGDLRKALS